MIEGEPLILQSFIVIALVKPGDEDRAILAAFEDVLPY